MYIDRMKRIKLIVLLFIFSITVFSQSYQALWVDSWDRGILTKKQIDQLMVHVRTNNINTLFVEIRRVADAYYDSELTIKAENISSSFDPLAYLLEKAHDPAFPDQPIQIHGWLVVNRIWKGSKLPVNKNHIYYTHPDWLSLNRKGAKRGKYNTAFLELAHPDASMHMVRIVREIISEYDIDGINLDYVRYSETDGSWGYSPVAIDRFHKKYPGQQAEEKNSRWQEFKRRQVTDLVKQISIAILTQKPKVMLSVNAITWGAPHDRFNRTSAYLEVQQDWLSWVQEGWVDINTPMLYKRHSKKHQKRDFLEWTEYLEKNLYGRHCVPTLGCWLNSVKDTTRQVRAVSDAGLQGAGIYSYTQFSNKKSLKREKFFKDVRKSMFPEKQQCPIPLWKEHAGAGIVAGYLKDEDGAGLENYTVSVLPGNHTFRSSINGFFEFHGLKPGKYTLSVSHHEVNIYHTDITVSAEGITCLPEIRPAKMDELNQGSRTTE